MSNPILVKSEQGIPERTPNGTDLQNAISTQFDHLALAVLAPALQHQIDAAERQPSTRLTNRGGAKSVPQAVWDKVSGDSTVLGDIGPANLMQSLEPVRPEGQNHLAIETVRDWLASYVYLPRLRDETTLNNALQHLTEDLASDYAFATSFVSVRGSRSCAGRVERRRVGGR